MSKLTQTFTDKLFADYQANTKFSAIENAVTHNGLLKSLETRQSEIENDYV
ncbi:TPA: aminopeptidase, partial [Streptococcus agalactiae]